MFDLVTFWLLLRQGLVAPALVWAAVYVAIQSMRWRHAHRVSRDPALDAPRALQRLGGVMVLLGALRAVPVALLFTRDAPQEQNLLSLIYIGMAAAAVVTAGGRWRVFLAWAVLAVGSLALAWAAKGTVQGFVVAGLIVMLIASMTSYVNDQQRTLTTMVELVDENKRLAARLRAERDHVAAASQSQTRFFAAAGHDLSQPLLALAMNATALEHLAQQRGDKCLHELSAGIRCSLDHARELLDSLLDISRLDAGAVQPDWQSVDVAPLLDSVRETYAKLADAHGLWLRTEVDPAAAPSVRADPALLRRILHNLVANAVKYTQRGGVTLQALPGGEGQVRLVVADTGPGIAAEDHERIFEEFVQGDQRAHPDRERGLGLGLAIVRRVAQLLQVPLQLDSAPGQGTQFALTLQAE